MTYLHIISFDIPFPADYGGVIDVYYKLKTLQNNNVKIILHCYEYGREHAQELNTICHKVFYYKRNNKLKNLFSSTPFIVKSRDSKELLHNLLLDNHPILFEGLHSCYLLNHSKLSKRHKIVRTHNIEHHYYENLGKIENRLSKKTYYFLEAFKLKLYEKKLGAASFLATISRNDEIYYRKFHPHVALISAFHNNDSIESKTGKGNFVLYHGNLSVGENNKAALFLVRDVFNKTEIPLLIAGNNPSNELILSASKLNNVKILSNCSSSQIDELIKEAHINILPTFQSTGIKLKLLNALFKGRFCLVNTPMIKDTGLEKFCLVKDTGKDLLLEIKSLMLMDFTSLDIKIRQELINGEFSNNFNGNKLIDLINKL